MKIYGWADSGFYCREAAEGNEELDARFVVCARKTARLVEELRQAEWKPSPKTDADAECDEMEAAEVEQYPTICFGAWQN